MADTVDTEMDTQCASEIIHSTEFFSTPEKNSDENFDHTKHVLIKGRKVKKRNKMIHFDESDDSTDDSESDIQIKSTELENKFAMKQDNLNVLFDIKNVLQSRITGKMLTHWSEHTKIDFNLLQTTNSLINKIGSYDSIFSFDNKSSDWNCDMMKNITSFSFDPTDTDKHKQVIDECYSSEKPNNTQPNDNANLNQPININSDITNDDEVTAKKILDKSFGTRTTPVDIVSSFNSWFSDIKLATKSAASATVSHAVKALATNAQNMLNNSTTEKPVGRHLSESHASFNGCDNNATSFDDNFATQKHAKELNESPVIDNDWDSDWDKEPILLERKEFHSQSEQPEMTPSNAFLTQKTNLIHCDENDSNSESIIVPGDLDNTSVSTTNISVHVPSKKSFSDDGWDVDFSDENILVDDNDQSTNCEQVIREDSMHATSDPNEVDYSTIQYQDEKQLENNAYQLSSEKTQSEFGHPLSTTCQSDLSPEESDRNTTELLIPEYFEELAEDCSTQADNVLEEFCVKDNGNENKIISSSKKVKVQSDSLINMSEFDQKNLFPPENFSEVSKTLTKNLDAVSDVNELLECTTHTHIPYSDLSYKSNENENYLENEHVFSLPKEDSLTDEFAISHEDVSHSTEQSLIHSFEFDNEKHNNCDDQTLPIASNPNDSEPFLSVENDDRSISTMVEQASDHNMLLPKQDNRESVLPETTQSIDELGCSSLGINDQMADLGSVGWNDWDDSESATFSVQTVEQVFSKKQSSLASCETGDNDSDSGDSSNKIADQPSKVDQWEVDWDDQELVPDPLPNEAIAAQELGPTYNTNTKNQSILPEVTNEPFVPDQWSTNWDDFDSTDLTTQTLEQVTNEQMSQSASNDTNDDDHSKIEPIDIVGEPSKVDQWDIGWNDQELNTDPLPSEDTVVQELDSTDLTTQTLEQVANEQMSQSTSCETGDNDSDSATSNKVVDHPSKVDHWDVGWNDQELITDPLPSEATAEQELVSTDNTNIKDQLISPEVTNVPDQWSTNWDDFDSTDLNTQKLEQVANKQMSQSASNDVELNEIVGEPSKIDQCDIGWNDQESNTDPLPSEETVREELGSTNNTNIKDQLISPQVTNEPNDIVGEPSKIDQWDDDWNDQELIVDSLPSEKTVAQELDSTDLTTQTLEQVDNEKMFQSASDDTNHDDHIKIEPIDIVGEPSKIDQWDDDWNDQELVTDVLPSEATAVQELGSTDNINIKGQSISPEVTKEPFVSDQWSTDWDNFDSTELNKQTLEQVADEKMTQSASDDVNDDEHSKIEPIDIVGEPSIVDQWDVNWNDQELVTDDDNDKREETSNKIITNKPTQLNITPNNPTPSSPSLLRQPSHSSQAMSVSSVTDCTELSQNDSKPILQTDLNWSETVTINRVKHDELLPQSGDSGQTKSSTKCDNLKSDTQKRNLDKSISTLNPHKNREPKQKVNLNTRLQQKANDWPAFKTNSTIQKQDTNNFVTDDWSVDWDDPEPVTLKPSAAKTNTAADMDWGSDWNVDWENSSKRTTTQKNQEANSLKPKSVKRSVVEEQQVATLPTQSLSMVEQPSAHYGRLESQSSRQNNFMTSSTLNDSTTSINTKSSQSSSWLNDIRSATKQAAVTTVTHAVSRWSFNPTNLLDAVVDNIGNVVGIPSADEMATVMRQHRGKKNTNPEAFK